MSWRIYVCTTPRLLRGGSNIDVPSLLGRLETRLNNPDVQSCLLGRDLEYRLIPFLDGFGQVLVNGRVVSGDGLEPGMRSAHMPVGKDQTYVDLSTLAFPASLAFQTLPASSAGSSVDPAVLAFPPALRNAS